jgi:hypothetical protein
MTGLKPSRDFDFFIGRWTCRHRYLARRLAERGALGAGLLGRRRQTLERNWIMDFTRM